MCGVICWLLSHISEYCGPMWDKRKHSKLKREAFHHAYIVFFGSCTCSVINEHSLVDNGKGTLFWYLKQSTTYYMHVNVKSILCQCYEVSNLST